MGLDFTAVFKKSIIYKDQNNTEFTPFSRALSNFFYANYYSGDSTLKDLEEILNSDLNFLMEPNLHKYKIDEMQLEFAEGEVLKSLLEKQKELDQNSHKAWYDVSLYLQKLDKSIVAITESNQLDELEPNSKNWSKYVQSGDFVIDLLKLRELLTEAQKNGIKKFTFQIY